MFPHKETLIFYLFIQNTQAMKKMNLQIIFMMTFMIFISCQKDSLVESKLSPEDAKIETRAKKHPVPFQASFVSTVSVFPPQPNVEVCEVDAPVFNLRQTIEGNASHMGHISGSISSCIDPTTFPPTIFNAKMTLIAANGDALHLEGSGALGSTFEVVGGTGRFDDATGSAIGVFQPIEGSFPPSFQSALAGEIQY